MRSNTSLRSCSPVFACPWPSASCDSMLFVSFFASLGASPSPPRVRPAAPFAFVMVRTIDDPWRLSNRSIPVDALEFLSGRWVLKCHVAPILTA